MCKARGELLGSDLCTVKLTSQDGSQDQGGGADVSFSKSTPAAVLAKADGIDTWTAPLLTWAKM